MADAERPAPKTLYLIDGSAYIYRAFFALPPLINSKGVQTNAVYGFTTMLLKVLREHRPDCLAIVFDEKGPTQRHEEYKEYKAQRPEMPHGMQAQVPLIHRVVQTLAVPVIRLSGYEADDLIGTLARKAEAAGLDVVIVTSDKDMFQLLTPAVRIYDPVKDKWFGEAECRERFGVEPSRVVEIMGLMGDAIDNIPGVKGIGEKTATKLIAQFGTIDELLRRVEEVPPKTRALLIEQAETARLSRRLASIQVDCPVEFDCEAYQVAPPPADPLVALLRELEFPTLLKMVQPAADAEVLGADVRIIHDEAGAREFEDSVNETETRTDLAIHGVLKGPPGVRADLEGLAISVPSGKSVFLPVQGQEPVPPPIVGLLTNRAWTKAAHDLKPTLLALNRAGLALEPPWFDTMIAAYLLNPNRRSHTVESVALDMLGYHLGADKGAEQAKKAPKDLFDVPDPSLPARAAEAAAVIVRLVPELKSRLSEQGSLRLFEQVEMPLVPVLAEIERNGFRLDVKALEALSKEMEREMDRISEGITRIAGEEFNFNSPKQLATVLFEKLGLKPLRKTKTGYSTDEDTLMQLATQHELPAQILACRGLSKLKSTYVDALPALVNPETGRLHTSLNQTVAATGRLSSTDPNLQNIPVKGEYGLRIREAFIATPGHLLIAADYSQVEPRILAHLSRDERLVQVFADGDDIHMATAIDIFNLAPDQITKEMRRVAKTVVFGILYGISPFGLSSTLGISQQKAREYIDAYFARYAGVKAFLDRTLADAKRLGYVTTILGRRRPIPELSSHDATQRSFGERMAINNPIQGSAADLIKVAMISVSHRLKADLPATKMILQVHDELIFETPEQDVEAAKQLVQSEMEQTGVDLGLTVPLKVDVGVGCNWRESHP
ncbi:MAG TPA: DNA polymerase I [Nitrospiraceae bacterium]|nr:DNA polymerase I [Nitrospiraceae bacterium]